MNPYPRPDSMLRRLAPFWNWMHKSSDAKFLQKGQHFSSNSPLLHEKRTEASFKDQFLTFSFKISICLASSSWRKWGCCQHSLRLSKSRHRLSHFKQRGTEWHSQCHRATRRERRLTSCLLPSGPFYSPCCISLTVGINWGQGLSLFAFNPLAHGRLSKNTRWVREWITASIKLSCRYFLSRIKLHQWFLCPTYSKYIKLKDKYRNKTYKLCIRLYFESKVSHRAKATPSFSNS